MRKSRPSSGEVHWACPGGCLLSWWDLGNVSLIFIINGGAAEAAAGTAAGRNGRSKVTHGVNARIYSPGLWGCAVTRRTATVGRD